VQVSDKHESTTEIGQLGTGLYSGRSRNHLGIVNVEFGSATDCVGDVTDGRFD
jgi:hypothetical protein